MDSKTQKFKIHKIIKLATKITASNKKSLSDDKIHHEYVRLGVEVYDRNQNMISVEIR